MMHLGLKAEFDLLSPKQEEPLKRMIQEFFDGLPARIKLKRIGVMYTVPAAKKHRSIKEPKHEGTVARSVIRAAVKKVKAHGKTR